MDKVTVSGLFILVNMYYLWSVLICKTVTFMKRFVVVWGILCFFSTVSYAQLDKGYIEKIAAQQSIVLQAEGWKATAVGLPLDYQLKQRFTLEQAMDGDSQKYFIMEGRAVDANIQTAKAKAVKSARKNIVLAVDESDDNTIGTLDIGSCREVISIYRKMHDGNFEVMVVLACPWENIQKGKMKQAAARNVQSPAKRQNAIESAYTL